MTPSGRSSSSHWGAVPGVTTSSFGAVVMLVGVLMMVTTTASQCDRATYYPEDLASMGKAELKKALHDLIKDHTVIPYTSKKTDVWDALSVLDQDPNNPDNVILVYSQRSQSIASAGDTSGWNREHVWPKSYGVGYTGPDTSDLHSLRAADWNTNSARNNLYFDWCTSADCTTPAHKEAAPSTSKDSDRFQPPAEERGDLARSLMYMAVRYDGSEEATTDLELSDCPCPYTSHMGVLSTLLTWHVQDPPDEHERTRNTNVCFKYQGNRNPFIDHPELAEVLFESDAETCSRRQCLEAASPGEGDSPTPAPTSSSSSSSVATTGGITTASPGDLAIVALDASNPDFFQFVCLHPEGFAPGLQIKFTDNGWLGEGGFRSGEGILTYTVGSKGVSPGEVVGWSEVVAPPPGWSKSGGFSLSTSGDQLIAYSQSESSIEVLYAVHWSKSGTTAWGEDAESSHESARPEGLVGDQLSLLLPPGANYMYEGPSMGRPESILRHISNVDDNWRVSNKPIGKQVKDFDLILPTTASPTSDGTDTDDGDLSETRSRGNDAPPPSTPSKASWPEIPFLFGSFLYLYHMCL